ncbi:MAG: Minf_1886 family protein [Aeoliella sp.]
MNKSMLDPRDPINELLERDPRYPFEAYVFVLEALNFAQERLEMGESCSSSGREDEDEDVERHVSGQDLCEATRQYAVEQYGLVARNVLAHWGIGATSDIGEIVFNMIGIGKMRKTEHDCREDFDEVYDFDQALRHDFEFTLSDPSEGPRA